MSPAPILYEVILLASACFILGALVAAFIPVDPRKLPRSIRILRMPFGGYESVSDWYRHHSGRVPIQMAWGIDQRMKQTGETFTEAWTALVNAGAIILIEPGE